MRPEYKKIRCPFCGKLFTESTLDYDFGGERELSTNRILCARCKRTVYYTVNVEIARETLIKT